MAAPAPDSLAALNGATLTLQSSRRLRKFSSALIEWTGRSPEDLINQDLGVLLTRGSLLYWETTVEPLLENQGFAWDLSLDLAADGDKRMAVLVNARRTGDRTDCLLFPFSERRDYDRQMKAARIQATRHKAAIARLEEMNEFRRNFVNTAAHQLATPMTPLQIQFHILKDRLHGNQDTKIQRGLDAMERNLAKLSKFTSDLVASTSVDAGRIGLLIADVDAAVVVPRLVEAWRERRAVDRPVTVEAGAAVIQADLNALDTCLTHLLDNAAKFSPMSSPIHIRVVAGGSARIIVADQGRGIEPGRLVTLGRPFQQAHDANDITELGVGLGLHIVGGLMKSQGGTLQIESEGHGKGTTATLHFPLAIDAPKPPADS